MFDPSKAWTRQMERRARQQARHDAKERRLARLRRVNISKLQKEAVKLRKLEAKGMLILSDHLYLQNLENDIAMAQKLQKCKQSFVEAEIPATKSIYYHPELNPSGEPPNGYNKHSMDEFFSEDTTDDSIADIPLPE